MSTVAAQASAMLAESFEPDAPMAPRALADTGLTLPFLTDLMLKLFFNRGTMRGGDLSRMLCLPFPIVEEGLDFLKKIKCIEISSGEMIGAASYRFQLTDFGRQRSRDALESNGYVGPAPVPLKDYIAQCYKQKVTGIPITRQGLLQAFSHMVVSDELIETVGPAVVSGKAVFIYGPPGTGKTTIAQAIGTYMNTQGGEIYVPHAVIAEGGVITIYDPIVHQAADRSADDTGPDEVSLVRELLNDGTTDRRWLKIRRPVIITGGELNLEMLDLRSGTSKNVYQAPLHIKANGGIFLIDDFGRQLVSPRELLNRWIFPLESRHDFLTLNSGEKLMVPFEQMTIFSTNMDPKDLVDDAFLRRMRHKLAVFAPERKLYEEIFNLYARKLKLNACPEGIDFLYKTYYDTGRRIARPSDARDLLEIVCSICRFRGEPQHLDVALLTEAARQFIPEFE